ncbi:acyl-CoA thioesterase [Stappia sp. ICDLI1TA098]|jgi:acyl-CoA thioester hydrolase
MTTRPSAFTRKDFRLFRDIPTRWMDVDTYGHVNNVQYLSFFDTAVNGWLIEEHVLDPRRSEEIFLVVETGCSYFSEIVYPDRVAVGVRVARLGGSSVTYDIALFRNDGDVACAQGRFVHVQVDARTRRPTPIVGARRALLSSIVAGD